MVHEYVSRLRQTLAEVASISTRPSGYVLQSAGGALDAQLFVQLTEAARAAIRDRNYTEALRSYDQALAFWRGDALADVALEGDAQIAVAGSITSAGSSARSGSMRARAGSTPTADPELERRANRRRC